MILSLEERGSNKSKIFVSKQLKRRYNKDVYKIILINNVGVLIKPK